MFFFSNSRGNTLQPACNNCHPGVGEMSPQQKSVAAPRRQLGRC